MQLSLWSLLLLLMRPSLEAVAVVLRLSLWTLLWLSLRLMLRLPLWQSLQPNAAKATAIAAAFVASVARPSP